MDLTVRDWMVIIGVVLILAVLLDAYRRVRSERREKIRLSLGKQINEPGSESDEALLWLKELPNGGARVVGRRDLLRAAASAAEAETAAVDAEAELGPGVEAQLELDDSETTAEAAVAGMSAQDDPENLDWLDGLGVDSSSNSDSTSSDPKPEQEEPVRLPRVLDPEIFMLNVVSRKADGFRGEDILHILLACDLRYGDMSFFHRHELEAGRGPIQFSVANMIQPGVFDLDNMADINTPGLVFFLTLPGPDNMMQAFDYMLETAQAVARNLGGDVLDETRSVITKQSLEHSRQQIRDLERRMLADAAR